MRKSKKWHKFFLMLAGIVLLFSCVNDDSFSEEMEAKVTETKALVTILNTLKTVGTTMSEEQMCFSFRFPIVLGYNTESTIRVDDFQGLLKVVRGQSSNFNITGVQFPIQVVLQNSTSPSSIANESELISLLQECGITTFRKEFDTLYNQCFRFEYPVTLFSVEKNEVAITTNEELDRFLVEQGRMYQPDFKFPVKMSVAPQFVSTTVSTYYEFYEVVNECVGCPSVPFEIEPLRGNTYTIIPNFEIKEGYELSFEINNEIISGQNIDGNPFTWQFAPGTYDVCIRVKTPDCSSGDKVCKNLVVESVCPNLQFEFQQDTGTLSYNFIAEFVGIDEVTYNWIVNDQVVEENDGGATGDNRFVYQFIPGTHNVCIEAVTPLCPQGTRECKEIVVCPELFFTSEQQSVLNYVFTASFAGNNDISYQWLIDEVVKEEDGGSVGGDNLFAYEFAAPGMYQICIKTAIVGCETGATYCIDLNVQ